MVLRSHWKTHESYGSDESLANRSHSELLGKSSPDELYDVVSRNFPPIKSPSDFHATLPGFD